VHAKTLVYKVWIVATGLTLSGGSLFTAHYSRKEGREEGRKEGRKPGNLTT